MVAVLKQKEGKYTCICQAIAVTSMSIFTLDPNNALIPKTNKNLTTKIL